MNSNFKMKSTVKTLISSYFLCLFSEMPIEKYLFLSFSINFLWLQISGLCFSIGLRHTYKLSVKKVHPVHTHNLHWFLKKKVLTCVCKYIFAGPMLFEAVHMQALPEVPLWTPGCYARFSWLHSVLLIATDFWKLGNKDCATERLLTSPAFPHSHF